MTRTTDFFYESGDLLTKLMLILDKEKSVRNLSPNGIQIFKFGIAVQIIQKKGEVFITNNGQNRYMILSRYAYENVYETLVQSIKRVEPFKENMIFLEKANAPFSNKFYFSDYVQKKVNDENFIELLSRFCKIGLKKTA